MDTTDTFERAHREASPRGCTLIPNTTEKDPVDGANCHKAQIGDLFRQSMRRLASAVSVVACEADGSWRGMSATSVTSLTMDPPAILVCANKQTSLSQFLVAGKAFSVNVLNRRHEAISNAFGSAKGRTQRFTEGDWCAGPGGAPVMNEALAIIECVVDHTIEYGSHIIVIGLVRNVRLGENDHPLIYCDGRYR